MRAEIVIFPDLEGLTRGAARRFVGQAVRAVTARGRFSVALSGGATPGALYRLLAQEPYRGRIPWQGVHLFWGDERCVPPDRTESNYRLAVEALILRVPIPPDNIRRVLGELEPEIAARLYETGLRDFFGCPQTRFDLVLLGLGEDGHTASLFPGSAALDESERLAVAVEAHYQDRPAYRVTLTLPAINSARQVWLLVSGSAKAEIVRAVLEGHDDRLPARRICPTAGRLTWLLDREAARLLRTKS